MITLTAQQLSSAVSMVRWGAHGRRDVLDYLRTYTVDDPQIGGDGVLAVSPTRMAENLGVSAHTAIAGLRWLVERGVVICHQEGSGSFPAVWSINGDLAAWQVEWKVDRDRAFLIVASMLFFAPYSAEETRFFSAPYSAEKTGQKVTISRLMSVHRGPFAPRVGPRSKAEFAHHPWGAEQMLPIEGAFSMPMKSSSKTSSSRHEEEAAIAADTPQALAVLGAITEVTGFELYDGGRNRPRSRVVRAVEGVEDVGYIVQELHRIRPRQWVAAIEMVCRLAQMPAAADRAPDRAGEAQNIRREISLLTSEIERQRQQGYPIAPEEQEHLQSLHQRLAEWENEPVTKEATA